MISRPARRCRQAVPSRLLASLLTVPKNSRCALSLYAGAMIAFRGWWRMTGRGYTIFDTGIGRCGIAWGPSGIIGVQLPEVREIDTRRRLYQLYPDARELRPPHNVEVAIEGIAALLRGAAMPIFAEVALDMTGIPAFDQRVYALVRTRSRAGRPGPMRKSPRPCAHPARSIRWRRRSVATPS